jgi:protein-disulfide isomerase
MAKRGESAKSTREKAAQARAAAEAAERRRERTIRLIGAAGVLVVVVGIVVAAVIIRGNSSGGNVIDAAAPRPAGAFAAESPYAFGVPIGSAPESAPALTIWEDFQCPACGQLEELNGAGIQALAEEGTVRLIWRPTTFLDGNLRNDASARATAAWGCAIDQGKTVEYHDWVFANQPADEGTGWTADQLKQFGADVGIQGDAYATFTKCIDDGTYLQWAKNSTAIFDKDGVQGTPAAFLKGAPVSNSVLSDDAALRKFIADATGSGSPSPSPSS